jgi:hypothetical protein
VGNLDVLRISLAASDLVEPIPLRAISDHPGAARLGYLRSGKPVLVLQP